MVWKGLCGPFPGVLAAERRVSAVQCSSTWDECSLRSGQHKCLPRYITLLPGNGHFVRGFVRSSRRERCHGRLQRGCASERWKQQDGTRCLFNLLSAARAGEESGRLGGDFSRMTSKTGSVSQVDKDLFC